MSKQQAVKWEREFLEYMVKDLALPCKIQITLLRELHSLELPYQAHYDALHTPSIIKDLYLQKPYQQRGNIADEEMPEYVYKPRSPDETIKDIISITSSCLRLSCKQA